MLQKQQRITESKDVIVNNEMPVQCLNKHKFIAIYGNSVSLWHDQNYRITQAVCETARSYGRLNILSQKQH